MPPQSCSRVRAHAQRNLQGLPSALCQLARRSTGLSNVRGHGVNARQERNSRKAHDGPSAFKVGDVLRPFFTVLRHGGQFHWTSRCRLDIKDESSQHAGHAAMKGLNAAETHFRVTVVSSEFEGLTSVKRHQLVYKVKSVHYTKHECHAVAKASG